MSRTRTGLFLGALAFGELQTPAFLLGNDFPGTIGWMCDDTQAAPLEENQSQRVGAPAGRERT